MGECLTHSGETAAQFKYFQQLEMVLLCCWPTAADSAEGEATCLCMASSSYQNENSRWPGSKPSPWVLEKLHEAEVKCYDLVVLCLSQTFFYVLLTGKLEHR